jgi:hypothetical protein
MWFLALATFGLGVFGAIGAVRSTRAPRRRSGRARYALGEIQLGLEAKKHYQYAEQDISKGTSSTRSAQRYLEEAGSEFNNGHWRRGSSTLLKAAALLARGEEHARKAGAKKGTAPPAELMSELAVLKMQLANKLRQLTDDGISKPADREHLVRANQAIKRAARLALSEGGCKNAFKELLTVHDEIGKAACKGLDVTTIEQRLAGVQKHVVRECAKVTTEERGRAGAEGMPTERAVEHATTTAVTSPEQRQAQRFEHLRRGTFVGRLSPADYRAARAAGIEVPEAHRPRDPGAEARARAPEFAPEAAQYDPSDVFSKVAQEATLEVDPEYVEAPSETEVERRIKKLEIDGPLGDFDLGDLGLSVQAHAKEIGTLLDEAEIYVDNAKVMQSQGACSNAFELITKAKQTHARALVHSFGAGASGKKFEAREDALAKRILEEQQDIASECFVGDVARGRQYHQRYSFDQIDSALQRAFHNAKAGQCAVATGELIDRDLAYAKDCGESDAPRARKKLRKAYAMVLRTCARKDPRTIRYEGPRKERFEKATQEALAPTKTLSPEEHAAIYEWEFPKVEIDGARDFSDGP